jgi:hypothetical protein
MVRQKEEEHMERVAERITVRFGDLAGALAERAAQETEAAGQKVTVSVVIRRALGSYLGDRPAGDPGVYGELAKQVANLVADMGRIGGNLNQIAHYYNIHDTIQPHELAAEHKELRRQFNVLMVVLKGIKTELGRKN